jgi:hypothetical protein
MGQVSASAARAAASKSTSLDAPIRVMFFAFAAVALARTYADFDLWGHTRFGLDWLATRALPSTDPFSFTQDRPWINHEWLSEAAMGLAFRLAGSRGLIVLKMTIVGVMLAVLAGRLRGASALVTSGRSHSRC